MLTETETVQYLWYTRREGTVTGPFPVKQIKRHILLGRIVDSDELSTDKVTWKPLSELPELVPTVMKNTDTPEEKEALLKAKMAEDERKGERRNNNVKLFVPRKNRRGKDRRQPEPAVVLEYRKYKSTTHNKEKRQNLSEIIVAGFAAGLVLVFGLVIVFWYQPNQTLNRVACQKKAQPKINWNNCQFQGEKFLQEDLRNAKMRRANLVGANFSGAKLHGSDLSYADLTVAKLKQADLSKAKLVGAVLNNADLQHVNLKYADLSYANLRDAKLAGANLKNAKLDYAIWVDQRRCAAGSLGRCR